MAEPLPAHRPPRPWRFAAATLVALSVLAGCGGSGDSGREQAAAVARAYDRAYLTGNGRAACSLLTTRLRRELGAASGVRALSACAQTIAFARSTVRDLSALDPTVTAVQVHGSRATVIIPSTAGVATLPLAREAGRWRVAGAVHYISRTWLQADYRVRDAGGLSASGVASSLDRRATRMIGTLAQARAIGPDEVRVAVAEPARLADLALVTRRDEGRLAFYDWEANALTPAGTPVSDALRDRDGSAMLISQGSGTDQPGATGGLTRRAAVKLAAAQRPVPGVAPSQRELRGVPRGWMVVEGLPPSRAAIVAGANPGARYYVLRDRPALSRSDITDAYLTFDARGRPAIGVRFTPDGARAFQRLSAQIARRGAMLSTPQLGFNQHFAAVVDGKLVSVIFVNYHVYPHGIPSMEATDIAGGFSPMTAYQLANEIAAPPLPADLQLIGSTSFTRRVPPDSGPTGAATTAPR